MSEISEIKELGETAYGGYCQASGGKSLVSGASLPLWDEQAPEIRQAWNLAAMAVVDRWQQAGEDAPGSEPRPAPGDVRPRENEPGWYDVTCGSCGEEFGTNFRIQEIECAECEARRCPHCATWFGGEL